MTDDLPVLAGPVEVVGAGLIGTSIALVCRRLGLEVVLRDTSEENLRTASGLGAGRPVTSADRPQLVVVAVPPATIADAIVEALGRSNAVVTDVGSVKAAPLAAVAGRVAPADLDSLITAVAADSGPDLVEILERGNAGTAAIPGKHGGPARPTRSVFVSVPDHPGELARLFGDAGEIGVNIEDVHIDHDPGRPVGLTELVVDQGSAEHLLAALESRGWTTHR